jgi:hypothetical protein
MKAALIALGIGILLIIVDWHMATKPDQKTVIRRRKPLSVGDRKRLRGLAVWTAGVTAAAWLLTKIFG